MKKYKLTGMLAVGAAAGLVLAGCASGGSDAGDAGGNGGSGETITLGYIPSWTDGLSTAYLLSNQLEKLGYEVEMEELTEAGVLYTGLSRGDVDIYPSAWSEVTHAKYMEEFGQNIEDLGSYYDNASLTIAVPSYTDIDSLDQLADNADKFDGKIIGIEPGAGLTGVTQDSMMPAYGLDNYELVTSSTATMLTELGTSIDKKEDIVVTLWRPFWAYNEFDLKDLKDPLGAMGDSEALHFLGKQGFSKEYPDVAELIAGIKLDDASYGSLESLVTGSEFEGDPAGAVERWIEENPDAFPTLITE